MRRAKHDDPLRLDQQLCFELYACSLAMTRSYKPLLAKLGLTYPQYLVMLALWEGDGGTVSEIGARLALDSGTLTPLLRRLQAAGMVERRRDTSDERRVRIHLTAVGRALRAEAQTVPARMARATGCGAGEAAALRRQLAALRSRLVADAPAGG